MKKEHLQYQVIKLLKELNSGSILTVRGLKVKEKLLNVFEINPLYCILDFSPKRKFNRKYFGAELYWYLSKSFSINYISQYASFWRTIVNNSGKVNSNYGYYCLNQFNYVYNSLKKNKYSRQAVISIYNSFHPLINNKDIPCTIYLLFWIRENKLNMKTTMRSNDIFWGLTYDAPFFSIVMQNLYLLLKENVYPELKLGTYYHYTDNIHYYVERHQEVVDFIISQDYSDFNYYELKLEKPIIDSEGKLLIGLPDNPNPVEFLNALPIKIQELKDER